MGHKGPFSGAYEKYLVLYHLHCICRDEEDELL